MSRPPAPREDAAQAGGVLGIELAARAGDLAAARERLRAELAARGVSEEAAHGVDLVLEEIAGNAIRYGFDDGITGTIRIAVEVRPRALVVTLEDDGRPFDPTQHPPAPRTKSLAAASIGGRGIATVRALARTMTYHRDGACNVLQVELPRGG